MGSRRVAFPVKKVNMLAAKLTAMKLQRKEEALVQSYLQVCLSAKKYDVAVEDEFSHLGILDRDP